MRIVFMGTPDFAVPTLTELVAQGHEVVAAYTQPPRPAGRGQKPRLSAVHHAAEQLGVPVRTPKNFKSAADIEALQELEPELCVVVAYGLLLPRAVLDIPPQGCLNLHGSKLPRWRGAAPIQRAIMAGDTETAVMVMKMDEGLDTGPVALSQTIAIGPDMTAGELHDMMMREGADLMVRALAALEREALTFTAQPDTGATYAKKIDKAEARIAWSLPASQIHNKVRGLSPFPGAWFEIPLDDRLVRVKALKTSLHAPKLPSQEAPAGTVLDANFTIACGQGTLRLERVQREGKAPMSGAQFLRGAAGLVSKVLA